MASFHFLNVLAQHFEKHFGNVLCNCCFQLVDSMTSANWKAVVKSSHLNYEWE